MSRAIRQKLTEIKAQLERLKIMEDDFVAKLDRVSDDVVILLGHLHDMTRISVDMVSPEVFDTEKGTPP